MPAVITHDLFGREAYTGLFGRIGQSKDEFDAFLLGCQGPDILFFSKPDPTLRQAWNLGSLMHRCDASELIERFYRASEMLPEAMKPVGISYTEGLICHYLLDSAMHPFIYAQQFALCNAGVDGLDETSGHDVHALIESELDILVLSTKEEKTIADYDPSEKTLRISPYAARIVSLMYKKVAREMFGKDIPENAIQKCISSYRLALGVLHSPSGVKRQLLGMGERLFRKHSIMQAMSHENRLVFESDFDNREHAEWENPWTGSLCKDGFWDIYDSALMRAKKSLPIPKGAESAYFQDIAPDLDFNGKPVHAKIVSVE